MEAKDLRVVDLIEGESRRYNIQKLEQHFDKQLVNAINEILLSIVEAGDKLVCPHASLGECSIKSAYNFIRCNLYLSDSRASCSY